MKRNFVRVIVAALLIAVWGSYLYWNHERIARGRKPQLINCVSNLKQIQIAFRLWLGDHNNQYPWNVSTNQGGTREITSVDKDGFAVDPVIHFKAIADELQTPIILVCPKDASKRATMTFTNLSTENITYRLHILTNTPTANSKEVLLVCPIEGNILFYDGTVKGEVPADENGQHPMEVSTNIHPL